MVNFNMQ